MHLVQSVVAVVAASSVSLASVGRASTAATARDPLAPIAARTADSGGAERVELKTEDKLVIVGSYYAPKDAKKLAPAALLVHNAGGRRGDLAEVALRLQKQGFAVLAIDLRAHGDSVGPAMKPWSEMSESERAGTWTFALRDIEAGARFLHSQPNVHGASLSLLGDRAGCTLVTRRAARDENVRSLVLLDPLSEQFGFDLQKDIESLGGLPTFIAVTKEEQRQAETLAKSGEDASGSDFIEIAIFKGVTTSPVIDKRLPSEIARFMSENALPKKGSGD
jgi:pimeloyl-ACP methyl ester carboxylesterase